MKTFNATLSQLQRNPDKPRLHFEDEEIFEHFDRVRKKYCDGGIFIPDISQLRQESLVISKVKNELMKITNG